MITEIETEEPALAWLPSAVLHAILNDASLCDPSRADLYASVDAERARQAIDAGDAILGAHHAFGSDDAIDTVLARSALLVVRGLIQLGAGGIHGR